MPSDKYFPLPQLAERIAREKEMGKTIVLANGGFDLIHVGHIRYLQQAKAMGDILVVALNSDSSLKKLKGGRPRPDRRGGAGADHLRPGVRGLCDPVLRGDGRPRAAGPHPPFPLQGLGLHPGLHSGA